MDRIRARSFLPRTAVLEMTYRCNHRCIYCSCPWERADGHFQRLPEMSGEQWRKAVAELCEAGVTSLAFTGGEALLRPDLLDIVEAASQCSAEHIDTVDGRLVRRIARPDLYLLSNGRLVDDRVLRFCSSHGVRLSMSLPGLETFEEHTGFEGADMVLEKFARARELGVSTTVNITVTRINLYELERTMAAALLSGADQVLLNRFLPGGRGLANAPRLALDHDQVKEMLATASFVLGKAGRPGSLGTETPFCVADPSLYPGVHVGTRCSAATHFFTVGPSGLIRVCNHSEVSLAHVAEWRKLKDDPYWKTFVFRRHVPPECRGCDRAASCDAGCREAAHIVTGSLTAPDPAIPPEAIRACAGSAAGTASGNPAGRIGPH